MHGLTGGSWKRNKDRARATEMKDTRGNPAVTSGFETYRRSTSPRQLSTLRDTRGSRLRPACAGSAGGRRADGPGLRPQNACRDYQPTVVVSFLGTRPY